MKKLLILVLLLLVSGRAWAVTATFQEGVSGYTGTKDAVILSASNNEHITDITSIRSLTADGRAYILYFDISSIPTNATVSSATLTVVTDEANCTAETVGVRSIQDPDSSGAFAANTSAADVFNQYGTWRYKNESGTVKWSTGGGASNFTDVYNNSDESTYSQSACPGASSHNLTVTNMVQGWVTTPASNSGMVLSLASTGNVPVKNRFDATSSNRPLLTVNYTSGHENSIKGSGTIISGVGTTIR